VRIEKIVKSLLIYSRDTKSQKKNNNIKNIVYEALSILDQNFRKDSINIKFEWDNNFPLVNCNFQQIEQVLINILRNAYQALAQNLPDNRQIVIRGEVHDCSLHLTIANNGPNIPPEILKSVLKPFVTTKHDSEGTGLGLSISEDIMKAHNGKLEIHSEPECLTEMTMIFPLGIDTKACCS
jgi:C4-dicarboxylate-specific signal transduction histidine kinase